MVSPDIFGELLNETLSFSSVKQDGSPAEAIAFRRLSFGQNSILLVDMADQLRDESSRARVGAGSDTNGPLTAAVIDSLVCSTLLTLVVIPSVYSLVRHRISRFHKNVIQ